MNIKLALSVALLFVLTGCARVPSQWGVGELEYYYDKGDLSVAEEIVAQNGGFKEYKFFPISTHILLKKGLSGADPESFREAVRAIDEMKKVHTTMDLDAYIQISNYFRVHGQKYNYGSTGAQECGQDLEILQAFQKDFGLWGGVSRLEGVYWYSLYVNSVCATGASQAIYLESFAELDYEKAKAVTRDILSAQRPSGSARSEVLDALCADRQLYDNYSKTALSKLEEEGVFSCEKQGLY